MWPPLTTVRQPMDGMARAAVEMLIAANRADGAVPVAGVHRVLPHELVVRDSTSAPAIKASTVARRRH